MNPRLWYGTGNCLAKQDKWFEAIHFLNKALKLDSENPTYWKAVADVEIKVGNIISGCDAYEEASYLDPKNIWIWLNWSMVYYDLGDFNKSIEIILTGMEHNPDDSNLYYRITAYLIASGKFKEAFNYLENALILDFDNHTVLFEFFP